MKPDEYYEYMFKRLKNDILDWLLVIVFLPMAGALLIIFFFYLDFFTVLGGGLHEKPFTIPGFRIFDDILKGLSYIFDGFYGYLASLPEYVIISIAVICVGLIIMFVLSLFFDAEFDKSERKRLTDERRTKSKAARKLAKTPSLSDVCEGYEEYEKLKANAKDKSKKADSPVEKVDWTGD